MPNPSGGNNLFIPEPPYGDVQRQRGLLREAPISGAPVAAQALETPRRAQRRGSGKTNPQPEAQAGPPTPAVAPPAPSYGFQIAQLWAQIAATPGAERFPILQEYAQLAEQHANG